VDRGTLLLTGATGFVGNAVRPRLSASGWHVRGLTRDARQAALVAPGLDWAEGNVEDEAACARALDGCREALYLVHGMGGGPDFERRETTAARLFARAAAVAGVHRIVYLGGMAPAGQPSPHLRSRLMVGEALRAGAVPVVELRASMIVGYRSLSWMVVRDLVARLPIMVLPRWLRSRTQPVAIADVVAALVAALDVPLVGEASFDLPGPEVMSGRQILEATAEAMGLARPSVVEVPVLTPGLSSQWVRLVTRARWDVAREVVVGLEHDVLARDARYWDLVDHTRLLPFHEAAARALEEEAHEAPAAGAWGAVERLVGLRHPHAHA
jgi:uncharacterized protein YbjT (DUF2867 family)